MAGEVPLKGGELNAAVTSALVGIQTEYLGPGPRSASTFHYGQVLVTLMYDVLTPAEKSLARADQTEAVNHIRHLFQRTMEADFREAVEPHGAQGARLHQRQPHRPRHRRRAVHPGRATVKRAPWPMRLAALMSEAPPRRDRGRPPAPCPGKYGWSALPGELR
jgi:uncharacterized protein YbcI